MQEASTDSSSSVPSVSSSSLPHWLSQLLQSPKLLLVSAIAAAGFVKLVVELRRDFIYYKRVQRHKRLRPPPLPAVKRPSVTSVACEWEEYRVRPRKGIQRLTQAKSLDNLQRMSFRPGSKLTESDSEEEHRKPRRPYRILCVDGGGVKGVFSLRLLERLVAKFPTLIDSVDLIAGTSTGGLIALMLANGYTPTQGLEIYRHNIPIIFHTNIFRRLAPFLSTYPDRHRWEVFTHYFGNLKLGDLGKHVIITAFRMDGGPDVKGNATFFPSGSWRPALMSNLPLASGVVPPDNDLECRHAAMRTTSAPTYFPIFEGYGDGGLFANNPALSAIGRAYAHFPLVTPENTVVLSLGTGHNLHELTEANGSVTLDWGLQQWAPKLLSLLMEANQLSTEVTLKLLLKGRYHRVDSLLDMAVDLDDVSAVSELLEAADNVDLTATEEFIVQSFLGEIH